MVSMKTEARFDTESEILVDFQHMSTASSLLLYYFPYDRSLMVKELTLITDDTIFLKRSEVCDAFVHHCQLVAARN